jgi:hypothetical protein
MDELTGFPAKGQGVGLSIAKDKFKRGLKKQEKFNSEEPGVVSSSLDVGSGNDLSDGNLLGGAPAPGNDSLRSPLGNGSLLSRFGDNRLLGDPDNDLLGDDVSPYGGDGGNSNTFDFNSGGGDYIGGIDNGIDIITGGDSDSFTESIIRRR